MKTKAKELTIDELKVKALMQEEDFDQEDAQRFLDRGDYLVLTDEEADEKAGEEILNSAWAFRSDFLASFTGYDESIFKAIQDNGKCESNNDAILQLIDGNAEFVEEAIMADGRGHFISHYDGKETEIEIEGERFYIYRLN